MKEYLLSLVQSAPNPLTARNQAREYLQALILQSLFLSLRHVVENREASEGWGAGDDQLLLIQNVSEIMQHGKWFGWQRG